MSNQAVIEGLKKVLADSYYLYLKTQNYHWNVTGPNFPHLHALFEQQYTDLATAIDTVAELIRGLGEKTPGTWKAYAAVTSIGDGNENADAQTMVRELASDQHVMQRTLQAAITAAQAAGDEVVAGALIERLTIHRKNAWMLEATLK